MNLSWSTPLSNGGSPLTGYNLYRSTSSGTETLLVNLGVVNSYSDTAVTNGTPYYYEVTATNAAGESLISTEASATPTAAVTKPSAPTNLVATGATGAVNLSWSTPLSNGGSPLTGYNLYRSTSSGTETLLVNLGVVNSYSDTAVTNGTPYYYEVTATNAAGESVHSTQATARRQHQGHLVPGVPQSVAAQTASFFSRGVTVSWRAPASNGGAAISGYRIYRATRSGQETLYSSVTCTATSCSTTDTGTTSGTTYYYEVAAVNSDLRDGSGPPLRCRPRPGSSWRCAESACLIALVFVGVGVRNESETRAFDG